MTDAAVRLDDCVTDTPTPKRFHTRYSDAAIEDRARLVG